MHISEIAYYIRGLLRQPNAKRARDYLGIEEVTGAGITQLTGDVTAGPGSGSQSSTISNNAVTYAKMQDVSASPRLLGRGTAGAGDVEEISLGTNLSMAGTTLNATGGGATTPGGVDKNVQYNNAGAFGGVTNNGAATNKFLRQVSTGTPSMESVLDTDLSMTPAVATNDSSTTTHGFLKILDNNESNFMDGTGNWSNPTGGMAVGWFRFDSSTTVADPGAGDFRMNAGSWAATTILVFDQFSDPGNDVTAMIMLMRANDQILIQKKNDSTIFGRFTVTATPTNQTGWFTVPVTNVVATASIPSNTQLCAVIVSYDGGGGSGGIDALTGDVTATGPGTVPATIANNAVTYAKMQDVTASSRLIGRATAGSGDPEEVTLGTGLGMSGGALVLTAADDSACWKEFWLVPNSSTAGTVDRLGATTNTIGGAGNTIIPATSTQCQGTRFTGSGALNNDRALHDTIAGGQVITSRPGSFFCIFTTESTTSVRAFVGVTGGTGVLASDTGAVDYVGFRYSTDAADPNWMAVNDNSSGTPNAVDTGVGASGCHRFQLSWVDNTTIFCYIDGVLVHTITTKIPTGTMIMFCGVRDRLGGGAGSPRSCIISILRMRTR